MTESSMLIVYFVAVLALSVVFGFAAQKSQLCPVGGLRDVRNGDGWHRLATYFIVIAVALLATSLIEYLGMVQLDDTKPPYRTTQLAWGRYLIGGFIFGFGMVFAAGCGMRNLVRVGQGSTKALVIVAIMSITAYVMTRTDVYAVYFMPWLTPMTWDMSAVGSQKLSSLLFTDGTPLKHWLLAMLIGGGVMVISLRNTTVRAPVYLVSAIAIGLAVTVAYWLTGGVFGVSLLEQIEFMDPPQSGLGSQSFTFAAPMGDLVYWVMQGAPNHLLTFGVLAILGLVLGSFIASLIGRTFLFTWFSSLKDFVLSSLGAILVGVGAVVAMGCSIGHGVTGIATLALGSFMALFAIFIGAWTGLLIEKR